jgi:hypothetical protein
MKKQFLEFNRVRRVFSKLRKDYKIKDFKIRGKLYRNSKKGYTKISYTSHGLKVIFEGHLEKGEKSYGIFVKFNVDCEIEYNEVKLLTLYTENIPSLTFLKDLLHAYTLKQIIILSL